MRRIDTPPQVAAFKARIETAASIVMIGCAAAFCIGRLAQIL